MVNSRRSKNYDKFYLKSWKIYLYYLLLCILIYYLLIIYYYLYYYVFIIIFKAGRSMYFCTLDSKLKMYIRRTGKTHVIFYSIILLPSMKNMVAGQRDH